MTFYQSTDGENVHMVYLFIIATDIQEILLIW